MKETAAQHTERVMLPGVTEGIASAPAEGAPVLPRLHPPWKFQQTTAPTKKRSLSKL